MRQWFLTVDMLAGLDGLSRSDRVMMVRCADRHCIDVFTKKQLAIVYVLVRFRNVFARLGETSLIHITNRDDVFVDNTIGIDGSFAHHADARDVQFLIRRRSHCRLRC